MPRAFLAIPGGDSLCETVRRLQDELAAELPEARWTRPEQVHLTLRFFGDIPEETLEKIGAVMLSVGRLYAPFRAGLVGVGAFPSPNKPRVLWLGVHGDAPLAALYAALDAPLKTLGIPAEPRPFFPHLTLGRSRGPLPGAGEVLARYRHRRYGLLTADRLVLYESRLAPEGAEHRPRRIVPLAG